MYLSKINRVSDVTCLGVTYSSILNNLAGKWYLKVRLLKAAEICVYLWLVVVAMKPWCDWLKAHDDRHPNETKCTCNGYKGHKSLPVLTKFRFLIVQHKTLFIMVFSSLRCFKGVLWVTEKHFDPACNGPNIFCSLCYLAAKASSRSSRQQPPSHGVQHHNEQLSVKFIQLSKPASLPVGPFALLLLRCNRLFHRASFLFVFCNTTTFELYSVPNSCWITVALCSV